MELENAQKESRSYSAELYRTRSQWEESLSTIETVKRENKNLSGEFVATCKYKYIVSVFMT